MSESNGQPEGRGMGTSVMLKHFSLDHKLIVLDNENRWIEECYRDDSGNLHIRVSEETRSLEVALGGDA